MQGGKSVAFPPMDGLGGLVDTRCALYPPYIFGSGSSGLGFVSLALRGVISH